MATIPSSFHVQNCRLSNSAKIVLESKVLNALIPSSVISGKGSKNLQSKTWQFDQNDLLCWVALPKTKLLSIQNVMFFQITVPKFAISQSEANSTVLISYDIKSLTWYPSISWSLSSKVMLPYDKLQRGFANKQTTRNLRFSWCFAVKKGEKTFPPKLNWKTLANCGPLGITPGRFCYRNAKFWAEFRYGKYLIVPFGTLRRHIRLVWSRHGYFGETQSSQNTNHGSTKRAWYAAEAYQKGMIRYINHIVGYKLIFQVPYWRVTELRWACSFLG